MMEIIFEFVQIWESFEKIIGNCLFSFLDFSNFIILWTVNEIAFYYFFIRNKKSSKRANNLVLSNSLNLLNKLVFYIKRVYIDLKILPEEIRFLVDIFKWLGKLFYFNLNCFMEFFLCHRFEFLIKSYYEVIN